MYTIFKNLTIILIAYGEVLWFGGSVTGLTLVSFFLMVGSSVIAGWSDISTSLAKMGVEQGIVLDPISGMEVPAEVVGVMGAFNVGYFWMFANCVASASYVSLSLCSDGSQRIWADSMAGASVIRESGI